MLYPDPETVRDRGNSNQEANTPRTIRNRFGLLNNHILASGFTHTIPYLHFNLPSPRFLSSLSEDSDSLRSLSMPRVSGWLVSGRKKYTARKAAAPHAASTYCISRQEA